MKNSLSSRKVLIPLATLVAAGAIAVGSGATFTSSTSNSVSAVTAGTLSQTNSKANAAVFTVPAMKPGDVVNGSLTLTNSGTLPATYTLQEPTATNTFGIKTGTTNNLQLTITNTTDATTVYSGNFGALPTATLTDLGTFAAGAVKNYTFSVSLDSAAPNTDQGKTAGATFAWVGTQLAGSTTAQ
jgi:spore coat-associated protein N